MDSFRGGRRREHALGEPRNALGESDEGDRQHVDQLVPVAE